MRILLIWLAFLVFAPTAYADTYKCDEVDDLARLGYDGSASVSIVGKNKECKFSIGGASADGAAPAGSFEQDRNDSILLSNAPEEFMRRRLASIVIETAAGFGATAAFVSENISADTNLSDIACESSDPDPVMINKLDVTCFKLDDATFSSPQGFENGVISAVVFRQKFVFQFVDSASRSSVMVIFVTRRTQP
jgi:hypothetical protein